MILSIDPVTIWNIFEYYVIFNEYRGQSMRGAIPPLPQYVFMAWCLVKHRDNFTFTLNKKSGYACMRLHFNTFTIGWFPYKVNALLCAVNGSVTHRFVTVIIEHRG
jgi:hypothetical protein